GLQAWETPPRTEMLALLCRHRLAFDMVVEGEAPTGSQQGGTALEQGRGPRNVAPYVEAHADVKACRWEGDGVNVPEAKLHQMAYPCVARPRHSLLMADSRNIDA